MTQNIDQKTRKELVEIVKIQVEEFQNLHKEVERLEVESILNINFHKVFIEIVRNSGLTIAPNYADKLNKAFKDYTVGMNDLDKARKGEL